MLRKLASLLTALAVGSPWCCCTGAAAVADVPGVVEPPPMTCCGEPLPVEDDAAGATEAPDVPHNCPHTVQRDHQLAGLLDLAVGPVPAPILTVLPIEPLLTGAGTSATATEAAGPFAQAPPESPPDRCARLSVFRL